MACTKQPNCRCQVCENITARRVVLAYVPGEPTKLALYNSIDNSEIDLLPIIQAGETNTKLELIADKKMLRYFPEKWLSSGGKDGCTYDICLEDLFALMNLGDLGDVDVPNPTTGMTIRYNIITGKWEKFDLDLALKNLQDQITNQIGDLSNLLTIIQNLQKQVEELTTIVNKFDSRIMDIENAIYNWNSDKSTKIPRGTINLFSGGMNSPYYIRSRDGNPDNDLNQS